MDPLAVTESAAPRAAGHWAPPQVIGLTAAIGAVGIGLVALSFAIPLGNLGVLVGAAVVVPFLLAWRLKVLDEPWFLGGWVGSAVFLGALSFATGVWNGATDEPASTARYASLWPNLYGQPLAPFQYVQYGRTFMAPATYNIYLPLLAFVSIPGVPYRLLMLLLWGLTLYLLRRSAVALTLFGAPYVAILAANGFNDFVPLLTLTLGFVAFQGPVGKVFELVSLGMKQFANVLVALYHLWRRDWKNLGVTLAATAAFLLPFALLSPEGVLCHPILLRPGACNATQSVWTFFSHRNYDLWGLWAFAVFGPPFVSYLRSPALEPDRKHAQGWLEHRSRRAGEEELLVLPLTAAVRAAREVLRYRGFAQFAIVGASGVLVNLLVFTEVLRFGPSSVGWALVSSVASFSVATEWNFGWNAVWTFRGLHSRPLHHHLVLYVAIALASLTINDAFLYVWLVTVGGSLVGQLVGVLLGSVWGYVANRRWNFAGSAPL